MKKMNQTPPKTGVGECVGKPFTAIKMAATGQTTYSTKAKSGNQGRG